LWIHEVRIGDRVATFRVYSARLEAGAGALVRLARKSLLFHSDFRLAYRKWQTRCESGTQSHGASLHE
jgi:hypothetical protein